MIKFFVSDFFLRRHNKMGGVVAESNHKTLDFAQLNPSSFSNLASHL
jgi:hypothetical protein